MSASSQLAIRNHLQLLLQVVSQVSGAPIVDFYSKSAEYMPCHYGALSIRSLELNQLINRIITSKTLLLLTEKESFQATISLSENGKAPSTELIRKVSFYGGFPVKIHHEVRGVLSVMAFENLNLTQNQFNSITTLADEIGYFLALKTQLQEQSNKPPISLGQQPPFRVKNLAGWQEEQEIALRISMALQGCLTFEDLNNRLVEVLPKVLFIEAFKLILFKGSQPPYTLCSWTSEDWHLTARLLNYENVADIQNCILALRKPHTSCQCPLENSSKFHCACYPLRLKEKSIGVIQFFFSPQFSDLFLLGSSVCELIAEQISVTLHRLSFLKKLQAESLQDPLTKVFNRRYMMTLLTKLLNRVSYGHYEVGLIMLDIDHFKQLNDAFGHDAGDHVLRVLGLFLKGHARPNDAVCRYGGEEFALIMPGLNWDVLERRAHQLCRSMRYLSIKLKDSSLTVTVSAGFAIAPLHATTPSTLIKAADTALYEAKRTGRDRAVGASTAQQNPPE